MKKTLLLVSLSIICRLAAFSQAQVPVRDIRAVISAIDTFNTRMPAEKLYLQLDKPYYTSGDTLWFKAYLLQADFLSASLHSGIFYLELANDSNKVIRRRMVRVSEGTARGNIVLDKEEIPEGSYTLRAYTSLMRNFGEAYVFRKHLYIGSSAERDWLISAAASISRPEGKDRLKMALLFRKSNHNAVGLREMQVRVVEGKRTWLRDKVETDIDGKLEINFDLPGKADVKNISLIAEDLRKGEETRKMIIPVPVNRPANIDLQFMPEGGSLVNGISSRVGFKAIGEDGKGIDVSGKIYDAAGKEIAAFSSKHLGMGSFELLPVTGGSYTAKITLPAGNTRSYILPQIKNSGTALRIANPRESDSLDLHIALTPGLPRTAYYLIGQSGSAVAYAAIVHSATTVRVAKSLFLSGTARFSLLNTAGQPLNERLVYIDHHDNLKIRLSTDKPLYSARDSVALLIQVNDAEGRPVRGSFSVGVTDDSQVKHDSLGNNLLTTMLLGSGLKGTVEEPAWYFKPGSPSWEALDDLLLTQGWTGYNWEKIVNPPLSPQYKAEPEFAVNGRVSNMFNKGVAGTQVLLISINPGFFRDTVTNEKGLFSFKDLPPVDSVVFKLQALNRRGKINNVGIDLDEFVPPVFSTDNYRLAPWYVNSDTTLLSFMNSAAIRQNELLKLPDNVRQLKEVTITAKKVVKGSKNLNGPGKADLILDEKDMIKAGRKNLLQVLHERVSGFSEYVSPHWPYNRYYAIKSFPMKISIDGMYLDEQYSQGSGGLGDDLRNDYFEYIRKYLESLPAEDIKGVEVMKYGGNSFKYSTWLEDAFPPPPQSWIEVTTRSGAGVFHRPAIGTYLYRPVPFAGSREFYRPVYKVKDAGAGLTDLRSTIHWEPDVITDEQGRAVVSFYSADRPGTYTVIAEGTDLDGKLGHAKGTVRISK